MSTNEIQKLRTHFYRLNTEQQRKFVEDLQHRLKNSNNPEYKKFLNECVRHYNSETQVHNDESVMSSKSSTITFRYKNTLDVLETVFITGFLVLS